MNLIELTVDDGSPMAINPAEIAYVQAADDGTLVVFANGKTELARESYGDVMAALGQPLVEAEAGGA